ncbi:MBL fold metallo-hydrolase [Microbacterium sp. NPDC089189]|uniref:MBL fold metallo-hydrolase n=1 Tax=Microbacterium sp. NPDC089189 TaxID=3154972 RepID=UPI00341908CE
MRVTKHEHAALTLEKHGEKLLIDPGIFTSPLPDAENVAALVITHEHPDHWTGDHIDRILATNPGLPIYAPAGVVAAAPGYTITEVSPGDRVDVGPFHLEFFGGEHALIHKSIPVIDNVGVLVDDAFYYPGDSFSLPKGAHVALLAAPVGAPWLKIGDAIDFVLAVAPRQVFATHDMTLSVAGRDMGRERLRWAAEQHDGELVILEPGDSAEI